MAKGQSLLEVVIALGIFAFGLTAAVSLVVGQFTLSRTNTSTLTAFGTASTGLEAATQIRNRDWFTLTPGAHGITLSGTSWIFSGTSDTTGGITRTVTVTSVDDTTRDVVSVATWQTTQGHTRTITLRERLRDWRSIGVTGLSGDWTHPVTLGSVDLGPGIQANALAVQNHIVYIAASASSSSKPDFFVVDATDGAHPRVVGSVNTGTGLNEIAVSGTYAYVANDADTNQLQVIDFSNPALPQVVAAQTPSGVGSDSEAFAIFVSGTTLYLGVEENSGREFFIYDVSNPLSPTLRGSFEQNSDVNDIMVRGNYAYLATNRDDQELTILNISNPASPSFTGKFDVLGSSEEGMGVDVHDDVGRTYLVRTVGGNHTTHHEFAIINTTTPSAPTLLGSIDIPNDVNAVRTIGNLSFLGTSDSNNELKIYRTDDPAHIQLWSQMNFSQVASDIAYERNVVYVAVRSNDALRIITSSP